MTALALASSPLWGARKSSSPTPSDIRKAEMIYLESVNAENDGRPDDAYMLLRRAHDLNPEDVYIRASLAEYDITLPGSTQEAIDKAYGAVRDRFYSNTSDEQNAYTYINLAQQLKRFDDVIDAWAVLDSIMPKKTDPAMNLAVAKLNRYIVQRDEADYTDAMDILDRLERATGPSIQLSSPRIHVYLVRGDTAAVCSELSRLAASAPSDAVNNMFVGRLYAGVDMPDSALFYLNRAEKLDPSNGQIYLTRAMIYKEEGDSVDYDREVFRTLQSPAVEYETKYRLLSDYVVKLYTDSLQRPRIEHMFETLQEVNPGEASLHGLYGAYKAGTGDYTAAAEQFSYSVDLDPTQIGTWQSLVQVYSDTNDAEKMLLTCRKAEKYFPGSPYFLLNAALALAVDERPAQALAMLDSIDADQVANDQLGSAIAATRGDLLYRVGERDSAFKAYSEAIELNPDNYMALNNCAYYMADNGIELDKAELYASIAVAAQPENDTFIDTYAWVFFRKKDYKKAREEIDKVLKLNTKEDGTSAIDSAEVYSHAGDIYFMDGAHREALDFWKKALEIAPDDALLAKKVKYKTFFYSLDEED